MDSLSSYASLQTDWEDQIPKEYTDFFLQDIDVDVFRKSVFAMDQALQRVGFVKPLKGDMQNIYSTAADIKDYFYDLVEKDIDGQSFRFDSLRGRVVYAVNVASR